MRKLLLAISAAALAGGMTQAQQLPNADFSKWVACNPWTSDSIAYPELWNPAVDVLGTEPEGWCISNVMGMFFGEFFLGSTQVGFEESDGYNGTPAAKLVNSANPIMPTQIVPGYLTTGTTWSTAKGMAAENKDGGTFGGLNYAYTPDAFAMMYKRTHGEQAPDEPATVVAYLWKGTYKQADVPANIAGVEPQTVTMVNRDRNILGMPTAEGGEVTTEGDACLIAKINYQLTGNAEDWTQLVVPFEYVGEGVPEMANVIVAANDYFGTAESVGLDNTLIVDDVRMVFYSRALGISFAGMALDGFDPDRYMYSVPVDMPAEIPEALVGVELMSPRAKWHLEVDRENSEASIVVTNEGEDLDGKSSHTYIIKFKAESHEVPVAGEQYVGSLSIDVPGLGAENLEGQSVYINNDSENGVTVALYNFSMGGDPIGDIIIKDVKCEKDGEATVYTGHVDNLDLLSGAIHCTVDCVGTESGDGHLVMDINVGWIIDENTTMPISVKFDGWKSSTGIGGVASENAPVEYYNLNGVKMNGDALVPGLYIRVQGDKAVKIIVR